MRYFATIKIAFRALRRNKLRTILTMLGIIIGVGAVIAMDLYEKREQDTAGQATTNLSIKAKNRLATALVTNWMVDALKGSGVAIVAGDRIWQFHKQGDGSYSAPPGATLTLAKNGLGRYELTERNGPTWRFDRVPPFRGVTL